MGIEPYSLLLLKETHFKLRFELSINAFHLVGILTKTYFLISSQIYSQERNLCYDKL